MQSITPFLWFDANAEEAVEFYVDVFPDSKIKQVTHYSELGPGPPGSVMTITFELRGEELIALNGGPAFRFNEAVSFLVRCDSQDEIDRYWERLSDGGSEMACGWLKDRYGLTWQIVPGVFFEMIDCGDEARVARVLAAMNTMVKFDIAGLEAAFAEA